MFGIYFKKFWQHPLIKNLDVESTDRPIFHRQMIEAKPSLKAHLLYWYKDVLSCLKNIELLPAGVIVELGSGAGFIEVVIPDIVKTDVVENPFCSQVQDACALTYASNSVACLVLIGVFHHLADPRGFLNEANRVLMKGGRIVMVEPSNTFPQKFLCSILDHYEYFDTKQANWEKKDALHMKEANLALPWIVFFRDREVFQREFPFLKIKTLRYHSLLLMLLSGGMTYKSMIPRFSISFIQFLDYMMSPFMRFIGTSMTIELEKN